VTTTVPDAVRPTGPPAPGPTPGPTPDPEAVAALVQALTRQVRTLHVLKAQVARAQTEAERAMHTVLFVLHDIGPQRVSALAEHLVTDPSTTSRQTAELVKRELLERLPDPDDRRASLLAVTAAGREVVATMRAQRQELLGRAVHDWTAAEVHDLARSLDRFTDGLDRTRSGLAGAARTTSPTTETTQNAQEHA
jgi:DNA-binding MarR family transcriptional regulator